MYKCGQDTLDLFNKNYRQIVKISFSGKDESFVITDKDIIQGSFVIDRYSVSSSRIEIGSAVAAELDFKLDNNTGKFDNVVFEGSELFVEVGVKKWDANRWEKAAMHWIPCGYFLVDTPPRKLASITINALDRMMLFSKLVDKTKLKFPMTVGELINKCCSLCNVICASTLTSLVNRDYMVTAYPDDSELTYRTLIQWCAAITGTCAFMNSDGQLELKWYKPTDLVLTPSERYSSDLQENDITITGFCFTIDEQSYLSGTTEYAFDLSGNGLIQDTPQGVIDRLYLSLKGFTYRPYEATIKPAPYLYPMDGLSYKDSKGNVFDTIVTNITYTLNGNTAIAGAGETTQVSQYAGSNDLTKRQAFILEQMKKETDRYIASREQAVLELNQLVGNSLGLNRTEISESDGSLSYYFHNAATLADSNIIYTLKAGGFAWTDDWNNGHPVWQYGFSKNGNAVFNALSTYKISTDYLEAHCITSELLDVEYTKTVEQNIAVAITTSDKNTDDKLTAYPTTVEMTSAIKTSADSIVLSVSKTYATADSLGYYTKTSEVRSKFAMDASSVTIDTGKLTFNSNSIAINSDAFKLDSTGHVIIQGDAQLEIYNANTASKTYFSGGYMCVDYKNGDYKRRISLGATLGFTTCNLYDDEGSEGLELSITGRYHVTNYGAVTDNRVGLLKFWNNSGLRTDAGAQNLTLCASGEEAYQIKYGVYNSGWRFMPKGNGTIALGDVDNKWGVIYCTNLNVNGHAIYLDTDGVVKWRG